jgi:hypothetical protein
MTRGRFTIVAVVAGLAILMPARSAPAQAQKRATNNASTDPAPAISSLLPPGATVGKTTEWTITGRNLNTVSRWIFSGEGIESSDVVAKADGTSATLKVKVGDKADPGYRELRALGSRGISNLVLFRVDRLDQVTEVEPNDDLAKAQPVGLGAAVVAVLKPQDLDHYRITAKAGARATIDVEAQRLGVPVVPVVTVLSATGNALAQSRETPGTDHDCRIAYTFPVDGEYVIQVRDNMYAGAEQATYRLRLNDEPFATALFPLGGPRGQEVTLTVSGGNLDQPRSKSLKLPDLPGEIIEAGLFDGPGGPVLAPFRLIVGEGPELTEASTETRGDSATPISLGTTVNGRLEQPGEVDRFKVSVKKGQPLRIRVRAGELGSWLDSVVTLRDAKGATLAENDDPVDTNQQRGQVFFNNAGNNISTDSRLLYEPKADGELTLEIADRYGSGGPEYGYRLEVGSSQPDFTISLIFGTPAANPQAAARRVRNTPASSGAFNLKPGSSTPVNFQIASEGKIGPIEVRVEGLPPGVTAAPVTVKPSAPARNAGMNRQPQFTSNAIVLKVDNDAKPSVETLRIVATAKPEGAPAVTRIATASIPIENVATNQQTRPVMRPLASIPLVVLDEPGRKSATIASTAPSDSKARPLTLAGVTVPGVLLQGNRIDLALNFDPGKPDPGTFQLEAEAMGKGLATQTLVPEAGATSADDATASGAVVKVLASVDAEVGVRNVKIRFLPNGAPPSERTIAVVVRPPITVRARSDSIQLTPGGNATVWVGVQREWGFFGPVDLIVEGLPPGISSEGKLTISSEQDGMEVKLVMAGDAMPVTAPVALGIIGKARMPRGPVRVKSQIQPMLTARPAEK